MKFVLLGLQSNFLPHHIDDGNCCKQLFITPNLARLNRLCKGEWVLKNSYAGGCE